jgi:hypothetical protein
VSGLIHVSQARTGKRNIGSVMCNGTKFAHTTNFTMKRSWGALYKYIRQLFQTVIVPSIDYTASIWRRPKQDRSIAGSAHIRKLWEIERLAMKVILGCIEPLPRQQWRWTQTCNHCGYTFRPKFFSQSHECNYLR